MVNYRIPVSDFDVIVDGVEKIFDYGNNQTVVLESIDCKIKKGEFVSLIGPSGCGKSTLLMIIAGLENTTKGDIIIGGQLMTKPREDIGLMFQDPTLLPWKTALENVLFPIKILKRNREEYAKVAVDLLTRVGLEQFLNKKPAQLSGGMRQRVAICRALIYETNILLMDEPFSALDAITRDEMNQMLMDLWQDYKKTGVFVTHSIREAVYLSDRVLVMSKRPGQIIENFNIPFERPRNFSIVDTAEFNKICRYLRGKIASQH